MNKNFIIGAVVAMLVLGVLLLISSVNKNATVATTGTPPPGTSTAPAPSPSVPLSTPPPAPVSRPLAPEAPLVETNESVSVSNSTAVVSGQVTPNGAAATYWFDYGETTAFGDRTAKQAIGSGYARLPTPAYIAGLRANTKYYFRLSAENRFATVNGAMFSFMTNSNPPPHVSAPTTRTSAATGVSRTTANINGQVNPNGNAASYWFEYGKDTSLGSVTAFQSAGDGVGTLPASVSLSDLDPLTKYYFRLNAQNQYGTVNGAVLNFTTSGPPAPGRPSVETNSATNITASSSVLVGRINPNGDETGYWFEYDIDPLLSTPSLPVTAKQVLAPGAGTTTVTAKITGLNTKIKYYYRIVAKNKYDIVTGSIMSLQTK